MRVGLEIAELLQKKYPDHFDVTKTIVLLGNDATVEQLKAGTPPEQIIASWARTWRRSTNCAASISSTSKTVSGELFEYY